MSKTKKTTLFYLLLIFTIAGILRYVYLYDIPAEIYNDAILIHNLTNQLVNGKNLSPFFLSVGPLYFYLISPIVAIIGNSYLIFKIISTTVGLMTVLLVYILAKKITHSQNIALWSAFLLGVSKNHIILGRLGDYRILVPFISLLTYIFFYRYLRKNTRVNLIVFAIVTVLNLYIYIPAWVEPISLVILLILSINMGYLAKREALKKILLPFIAIICIGILPIIATMYVDRDNFFGSGYVGSKLFSHSADNKILVFSNNIVKSLLMFHVRGDIVFRVNPPRQPHLDPFTGAFFLIGIGTLLIYNRRQLLFLIVPLLLMIIPASLVVNFPIEVPNFARTVATLPFACILAGIGIQQCISVIKKRLNNRYVLYEIYSIILIFIIFYNAYSVFITYPYNLPNHNTPFGRIIAEDIDALPSSVLVHIVDCCWGEWQQPELGGILYALKKSHRIDYINSKKFNCVDLGVNGKKEDHVFYWNPFDPSDGFVRLKTCLSLSSTDYYRSQYGDIVFLKYTAVSSKPLILHDQNPASPSTN